VSLIKDAINKNPMTDGRGVRLYQQFLEAVADPQDARFRDEVLKWAVFQLLDRDVLLGYTDRMESSKSEKRFVEQNSRTEFWAAYRRLDPAVGATLCTRVEEGLRKLEATTDKLIQFETALRVRRGADGGPDPDSERAASFIPHLVREINTYPSPGEIDHRGMVPGALGLFCLAYAGSVSLRGWQYATAYSDTELRRGEGGAAGAARPELVYVPHTMRRAFLDATRGMGESEASGVKRHYWFSFGTLLATSLEDFPRKWTPALVVERLAEIKASLGNDTISVDGDPDPRLVRNIFDEKYDDFCAMGRDHKLFVKNPDGGTSGFVRASLAA